MARGFRYFGKKRGRRRTGSPAMAGMGEAVFFAALLLLGCWLMLKFASLTVPDWRVNHRFVETSCKVLDKQVGEIGGTDGPLYRPEIRIEYEVGGEVYRGWHYNFYRTYSSEREDAQAVLDCFPIDSMQPCWYDPANPSIAVLTREYRWWIWLVFTVPAALIVVGAGGLIYAFLRWGKSAERRAALFQRAKNRNIFRGNGNGKRPFPNVPQETALTDSPGTRLKFRLPMATSPGWVFFGVLAFCIVWNGVVLVFVVWAVNEHLAGNPNWPLTLSIIPFVLIGLGAIAVFFRQLLVAAGIGPTIVEISGHPLQPGRQYRLFVSQSGSLTVNALCASLQCEEEVTYRQGTDTRAETREVFRKEVFRREGFVIQSGEPFETLFDFDVPENIMHSFKAGHNEINWSLSIEGDVAGWPDYKRTFAVVVVPAAAEGGDAG